jgi:hypothetical protein
VTIAPCPLFLPFLTSPDRIWSPIRTMCRPSGAMGRQLSPFDVFGDFGKLEEEPWGAGPLLSVLIGAESANLGCRNLEDIEHTDEPITNGDGCHACNAQSLPKRERFWPTARHLPQSVLSGLSPSMRRAERTTGT